MRTYISAAAPAATSTTSRRNANSFFMDARLKPRAPAQRFPARRAGPARLARPVEIGLQDDGRRCGVELGFTFFPVALASRETALGFDAREPLVFDGDRQRRPRRERGDERG